MNDFLPELETTNSGIFGLNFVFKLLFFVVLVFYIFYSFLLLLRVRILGDTVNTPYNKFVQLLVLINLVIALVGGFLALILILPA